MNDKQMAALIMAQVLPLVQATSGLETVKMARNFQPRQQGAPSGPYVYFIKLSDHRHGSPERRDVWDEDAGAFVHTETQRYETTLQFMALVPQDPKATTGLTESDILNAVSGIMQSDAIISAFQAQEVGILRVTEVRNPYIVDDRDQFEATPSFDVVLTHTRQRVTALPAVVTYQANVSRI